MGKPIYSLICVCFLLSAMGCSSDRKWPENPLEAFSGIESATVVDNRDLGEAGVYLVSQMFVKDSLLYTMNPRTNYALSVYNLDTQEKKDFIRKGRGPGEVLALLGLAETRDGLYGLDSNNKRMADIRIVGDSVTYDFFDIPGEYLYTHLIAGDNFVIFTGMMEEGRYLYYDLNSRESEVYCSYPVGKEYENSPGEVKNRIMISSVMGMKPDQTKFVCMHYNSGVIDICRIENGGIVRHKLVDFFYPNVRIREGSDGFPAVGITRDYPNGFFGVQTDDNYIYAIYSGKTYEEYGAAFSQCDYLLVFDWDGNPVKAYHLEMPLTSIYWNESEHTLYGLSVGDGEYLVTYRLE